MQTIIMQTTTAPAPAPAPATRTRTAALDATISALADALVSASIDDYARARMRIARLIAYRDRMAS